MPHLQFTYEGLVLDWPGGFLNHFKPRSLEINLCEGASRGSCKLTIPEKSQWTWDVSVSINSSATKMQTFYMIMLSAHPTGELFHYSNGHSGGTGRIREMACIQRLWQVRAPHKYKGLGLFHAPQSGWTKAADKFPPNHMGARAWYLLPLRYATQHPQRQALYLYKRQQPIGPHHH